MPRRRGKAATISAPPRPPDFEFFVLGPAISARARHKLLLRAWSARVSAAAQAAWPAHKAPMTGDVDVFISEFSEFATTDRDNMAKPVLDAIKGSFTRTTGK
jgi:hypothetical protein